MNKIEKGITMAVEDFENDMIKLIEESGLPLVVCKVVLDKVNIILKNQVSLHSKSEREEYENRLKEGEQDGNN